MRGFYWLLGLRARKKNTERDMAEDERQVDVQATELSSDCTENRAPLCSITVWSTENHSKVTGDHRTQLINFSTIETNPRVLPQMENKRCLEGAYTEAVVQVASKNEPDNQAQRIQQTQSLPQLQSTDTQADR